MRRTQGFIRHALLAALAWSGLMTAEEVCGEEPRGVLLIHGGVGVLPRDRMTPELERAYRADLERALRAGHDVWRRDGATAIDVVEAAVVALEDSPLFNAGKGAVFTREGRNELDASIMDGRRRRGGAVASVCRLKNPISAARAVMDRSEHVLLIGEGAERFALAHGAVEVSPLYFWTESAWKRLQDARQKHEAAAPKQDGAGAPRLPADRYGTVGAVALDREGNLAAATSTGGMTFKRAGRVGDSPILGAGTYAENGVAAVSCTGHGEVFIERAVAYDLVARMKYQKRTLAEAAAAVFRELPEEPGGVGGLIAIDREGRLVAPTNTLGMYRGHITAEGRASVAIYAD